MAYSVRTDLNNVFGKNNIDAWADLDGNEDGPTITARIDAAIVTADDMVDSFMRNGPYTLPLKNQAAQTPIIIRDVSSKLAGVWLYEARGVLDMTPDGAPMHRLQWHKKSAMEILRKLVAGILRLDNVTVKSFAPEVI